METKKLRALLAASVAGLLAACGVTGAAQSVQADEDNRAVRCYGINSCQGVGECAGKGHSCAGQNACQGQGFIMLTQEECLRIEGGRLTPQQVESQYES